MSWLPPPAPAPPPPAPSGCVPPAILKCLPEGASAAEPPERKLSLAKLPLDKLPLDKLPLEFGDDPEEPPPSMSPIGRFQYFIAMQRFKAFEESIDKVRACSPRLPCGCPSLSYLSQSPPLSPHHAPHQPHPQVVKNAINDVRCAPRPQEPPRCTCC